MAGCLDGVVVSDGAVLLFHNFQRELSDWTCTLKGQTAPVLGYQGLKPFEFSAPDRFDVAVTARIPRFGRVAERNRSYLKKIGL